MNDTLNEKNAVIMNYVEALNIMVSNLYSTLHKLNNIDEINAGCIKTADIQLAAIKSQLIIIQDALDKYM